MTITIVIKDIVGNKAIESEGGERVKELVCSNFRQGNSVVVDFKGVVSVLSLFLNPAIGDLYGVFSEKEVREKLKLINIPNEYTETFKRVIERAKTFYKDREKVTKIIDEGTGSLNENNE